MEFKLPWIQENKELVDHPIYIRHVETSQCAAYNPQLYSGDDDQSKMTTGPHR